MSNLKYKIRRLPAVARGTNIDGYLSAEDNQVLYERWKSEWPEPLQFHGGVTAITCEMIMQVPLKELVKVFGVSRANRIYEIAKENKAYV